MGADPVVVDVVAWTPHWAVEFSRAKVELLRVLPADAVVEHIGSTSVPGLAAKPTIDILVTTAELAQLRADVGPLEGLGYRYSPKYFADDPDHLFLRRDAGGRRTEHLHVFHPRSPMPALNREFRDYLTANPAAAKRYADAKREAARNHPGSRAAYGTAKDAILGDLVAEARAWASRTS